MTSHRPPDPAWERSAERPLRREPVAAGGDPGTTSGLRRLALVGGLAAGVAVAATLLIRGEGPGSSPQRQPERGVVCPLLKEAFDSFEARDGVAFAASVRLAAREAELTLERSGQIFGRPEEVALRLRSVLDRGDQGSVGPLLEEAQRVCESLGRWS